MELFNILWEEIIMDFITKLLKSKDPTIKGFYDLDMVMIDKLIKYFHFIPFIKDFDAEQLRHFFLIKSYNIKIFYKALLVTKINLLYLRIGQH